MQFSKHNVACKTFITYFLVVIQPFQVDAQAAVCLYSLTASSVLPNLMD